MEFSSLVNGFLVEGSFDDRSVKNIFIPLIKKIADMQKIKNDRLIVFISAPPALGKSTLVNFLEHLAKTELGISDIQSIGIDGFHFYNDYLNENGLMARKGAIDTFDIDALTKKVEALTKGDVYFPTYDRNLHNPTEDSVLLDKKIILLEGNYLSATDEKWEKLNDYCDLSIFINVSEELLKDRLVSRKIRGGKTYEQALDFYEKSDSVNVRYVLNNHGETDITLEFLNSKYILTRGEI